MRHRPNLESLTQSIMGFATNTDLRTEQLQLDVHDQGWRVGLYYPDHPAWGVRSLAYVDWEKIGHRPYAESIAQTLLDYLPTHVDLDYSKCPHCGGDL